MTYCTPRELFRYDLAYSYHISEEDISIVIEHTCSREDALWIAKRLSKKSFRIRDKKARTIKRIDVRINGLAT